MERSESIMNLAAALAVAQGQISSATKDASAGKKYDYSTLDAIWDVVRKPLSENGLSVIQIPTTNEKSFYLETILIHASGEWMSGKMSLPVISGPMMNELQAVGNSITYARRYMLGAMVGVTSGDDNDGQGPSGAQPYRQPKSDSGMTLDKLLATLDRVRGINGFYHSPLEILDCRRPAATLPESDDTDGWRTLFVDARDYAKEQIAQEIDPATVDDAQNQPELFDAPPADAPGAYETE